MTIDWNKPIECVTDDHRIHRARYVGTLENPAFPRIVAVFLSENTRELVFSVKEDGYISTGCGIRNKVTKVTRWVNIYSDVNRKIAGGNLYDSEEEAKEARSESSKCIATAKIEWEE